ncbi:MAG: M23 family metallopeptidase [Elainella sp. C42_A2020_010]|nr:M23 family metallopeptidase [Elainella sp. C42_A2020_010]
MISLYSSSVAGLIVLGGLLSLVATPPVLSQPKQQSACPEPALSRLSRHRVAAGETLESIAQQYNLLPTTLMGFNPVLRQGSAPVGDDLSVPVGTVLVIPPYNGIQVTVPSGSSWRDIAKQYGVRADVLYEVNGCQDAPSVVFVPGVNWSPVPTPTATVPSSPIERYPLPEVASILRAYGWQIGPTGSLVFHSGVSLAADAGTPVFAVGSGTVAFAGEQGGTGNLVVINHAQGLQTRYARLDSLSVKVGQQVQAGTQISTVASNPNSSEPYLQFEVRSNSRLGWVAQDPGAYIQELRVGRSIRQ